MNRANNRYQYGISKMYLQMEYDDSFDFLSNISDDYICHTENEDILVHESEKTFIRITVDGKYFIDVQALEYEVNLVLNSITGAGINYFKNCTVLGVSYQIVFQPANPGVYDNDYSMDSYVDDNSMVHILSSEFVEKTKPISYYVSTDIERQIERVFSNKLEEYDVCKLAVKKFLKTLP